MKIVRVIRHRTLKCRVCGEGFEYLEDVVKVSEGCNPKYYHLSCWPSNPFIRAT